MKGGHLFTIFQIQVVGNVFVALGSLPFLTGLRSFELIARDNKS